MNLRKLSVFFLSVWFLCGCSLQIDDEESISLSSSLGEPTKTVLPTSITIVPSETPLAPATVTPTARLTQTASPTALPKLSLEEAQSTIATLMQTNGGCLEPCVWGLIPAEVSPLDAYEFFNRLARPFGYEVLEYVEAPVKISGVIYPFPDELISANFVIELYEGNGELLTIHAESGSLSKENVTFQDWAAFRPDTIVNTYGDPSSIKIFVVEGPDAQISYVMLFIYDEAELSIAYWLGDWSGYADTRQVCLLQDGEIRSFDYWLGAPQKNTPDVNDGYDLLEVSSISIVDFAQLLINEPLSACFEANEAILLGE